MTVNSGLVQKAGNVVRVRVQLIDALTEESRWSQVYDHPSSDVFKIQSEVASKIAAVLRIQLAERESRSLERPPTTNPGAYDQYLRARSRSTSRGDLDSAITELTRAVQLDSNFASAWALLATSDIGSGFLYDADPRRLDRAEEAIRRALALDSTSAMAWKARHDLEWNAVRGWHFPEALAAARHALTLRPSMVAAHNALGSLYFHYGFMEEARRELETSLSLDPRDGCDDPTRCTGFSRPRLARVQWYRQQFDSALATYQKTPYLGGFVWELAVVLNGLGRPTDGLALLDTAKVAGAPDRDADSEAARALLLATLGREQEAEAHIRSAIARKDSRSHFHHAQFTIACAYARMGRKAEAIEWLRQTAANGMPNYPLFRNDPNLRSLRGDVAYEVLLSGLKQQFEAFGQLVHVQR
jgi:tetratricopeptide (TPR) repeat protein